MQHLKLLDLKDLKQQDGKISKSENQSVGRCPRVANSVVDGDGVLKPGWVGPLLMNNSGDLISQLKTEETLGAPNEPS